MKARKNFAIGMFLLMGVSFILLSLNGCTKKTTSVPASADSQYKDAILNYTIADTSLTGCLSCVDSLPFESLNASESEALVIMREEEFLAHDVYLTLSQLYTKPIFRNITLSEQRHTDAIKSLINKYSLVDPAANHVTGIFTNQDLQTLYNSLVTLGSGSLLNGLVVGATIEDLDIKDLKDHLLTIDNQDIACVFNNLMRGSRNHLRSFYANIKFTGGAYTPQYLTQEDFDAIVNSKHETGTGNCHCN
ncbi:MAG: DUF2202 domain-containing protein [Bacteroidetes bacterium]|nr:DUF2202 domain-containing protein [Bacteroidota bacterium]